MEKWLEYENAGTYVPPRYTLRKRLTLLLGKSDFERRSYIVPLLGIFGLCFYAGHSHHWLLLKYSLVAACISGMLGAFPVFRRTTDEEPTAEGVDFIELAFRSRRKIFTPEILCAARITFWKKLGQKVDHGARWLSEMIAD
jgi:hypothetical protein